MDDSDNKLPVIRVLHQLGRSGGTLIAKCLAVMDDAVLLSEVHPQHLARQAEPHRVALPYHPLAQARDWFGLISDDDVDRLTATDPPASFAARISLIDQRCRAAGKNLILRDFNNGDFTGIMIQAAPPFHFSTLQALQTEFSFRRVFTVRHPAAQWVSLSKLFESDIGPHLERFLYGFRLFSEQAAEVGFIRYEDFTREPESRLTQICEMLELPYDAAWKERWSNYRMITGDGRALAGQDQISPARRNSIDAELLERLEGNSDYRQALELLGYPE